MFDKDDVKRAANGRWREILSLVISVYLLDGKHHACPKCGGKDRFRFTDMNGDGSTVCSRCGNTGDGFAALEKYGGLTFPGAVEFAAEHIGMTDDPATWRPSTRAQSQPKPSQPEKKHDMPWCAGAENEPLVSFLDGNGCRETIYHYRDASGAERFQKKRVDFPNGSKKVYLPKGFSKANDGILFNLPSLRNPNRSGEPVFFCEGEKDVDNLTALGYLATTCGSSSDWKPEYAAYFRDRDVVILSDDDAPGRKLTRQVVGDILGVAATVKVVNLVPSLGWAYGLTGKTYDPDTGGDVSDIIDAMRSTGYDDAAIKQTLSAIIDGPNATTIPADADDAWLQGKLRWLYSDAPEDGGVAPQNAHDDDDIPSWMVAWGSDVAEPTTPSDAPDIEDRHYVENEPCDDEGRRLGDDAVSFSGGDMFGADLAAAVSKPGTGLEAVRATRRQSVAVAELVPADDEGAGDALGDPGEIPESWLRMPGFVDELIDYNLENSPAPNPMMAFCGAVSMQAYLAGRKIRDSSNIRTNIYIIGLAPSGAGKNFPRTTNVKILSAIGKLDSYGEQLASGQGLEDALQRSPSLLIQPDEVGFMFQSFQRRRADTIAEGVMKYLLSLYTSSSASVPGRFKAGADPIPSIDQPNVVLFGTATPSLYRDSLSSQMLIDGLIARMMIFDTSTPPRRQRGSVQAIPDRIITAARGWHGFTPEPVGEPLTVEYMPDADEAVLHYMELVRKEYDAAFARYDDVAMAILARCTENAMKLALIYSASKDGISSTIGRDAVDWAFRLSMHLAHRTLWMAATHSAETPIQANCQKVIEALRKAPGRKMKHSELLKKMKTLSAKEFQVVIDTLIERGEISCMKTNENCPGRTGNVYRLVDKCVKVRKFG